MSPRAEAPADSEFLRLEVLQAYKQRFGKNPEFNYSPFGMDEVTRYHTSVSGFDVPDIHRQARERIEKLISEIHQGRVSQVVILSGDPGMGKSHLINSFRSREKAKSLRYLLVCNSNHWKSAEFEECLLDWMLSALTEPAPDEPHVLLEKIQDIAFQALQQIVDRPGALNRYTPRTMKGFFRRVWGKLTGSDHGEFVRRLEQRDARVFRRLQFQPFANHVCKRFLVESSNPFHRYVMHVLLRYLFEEDRELVLHWLRRKPVHDHFLKKLGVRDEIDRNYKILDVINILISLFTPQVADKLKPAKGNASRALVFFFAFDQTEARDALFENKEEWRTFFAQLSELYNALPNVFVLFTMTLGLRNQLLADMEGQFRDRIRQDQRFILGNIEDTEVLALYRQRISRWLAAC